MTQCQLCTEQVLFESEIPDVSVPTVTVSATGHAAVASALGAARVGQKLPYGRAKPKSFEKSFAAYEGVTSGGKKKIDRFDFDKHDPIKPKHIRLGSGAKYGFICDACPHKFDKNIADITGKASWCPYCSGHKLCCVEGCDFCYKKSFAACTLASPGGESTWAELWSDDNELKPWEVARQCNKKMLFDCDCGCGHTFPRKPNAITEKQHGCGYKKGRRRCEAALKCQWCFERSFAAHPFAQYCTLSKDELCVITQQSGKKLPFKCDLGHKFPAKPDAIVANGKGCPKCKTKGEKKVRDFLFKLFPDEAVNPHNGFFDWCRNDTTDRMLPFDIVLLLLMVIVETDGPQHRGPYAAFNRNIDFAEIFRRDRFKESEALTKGYSVVRMPTHWASRNLNDWRKKLEAAVRAASKAALAGAPIINDLFQEDEGTGTKRKAPAGKGKRKRRK